MAFHPFFNQEKSFEAFELNEHAFVFKIVIERTG